MILRRQWTWMVMGYPPLPLYCPWQSGLKCILEFLLFHVFVFARFWLQRMSVEMEEPVCLIETASTELKVNQEALDILSSITQPVVVVSIVGMYRTGKSYLMNRLAGKRKGTGFIYLSSSTVSVGFHDSRSSVFLCVFRFLLGLHHPVWDEGHLDVVCSSPLPRSPHSGSARHWGPRGCGEGRTCLFPYTSK